MEGNKDVLQDIEGNRQHPKIVCSMEMDAYAIIVLIVPNALCLSVIGVMMLRKG